MTWSRKIISHTGDPMRQEKPQEKKMCKICLKIQTYGYLPRRCILSSSMSSSSDMTRHIVPRQAAAVVRVTSWLAVNRPYNNNNNERSLFTINLINSTIYLPKG